ncbi:hypothetical protein BJ166DRAFT_50598 [Pestalotiopsis sp. NC0098]|nr:hypothetical protein BJ166DRAFT_50598 [Pestalotiopsis sp. NC0098]
MDHSQPFPSVPNSSIDEISGFLKDYSISGSYPSSSYTEYADSMPTSAPSLRSTVLPGNSEYVLPCEFIGYDSCDQYFYPVDADQWMNHIIVDHLQEKLPNKSNCWFCDNKDFDARRDRTDKASSFRNRLDHIRIHIQDERLGIRNMRPDYDFVAHLWKRGLIRRRVYEAAQRWREGPVSHVEGIVPHDFIPEEQIQREEQSQKVVVSDPRERGKSHKSHRHRSSREDTGHHHKSREDTGHHHKSREHSRKSSAFGTPLNTLIPTLSPTAKQYYQSDSSNRMALNTSRAQSPRSDHEVPLATRAEGVSDVAANDIPPSTDPLPHLSDKHSGFSLSVPQTVLPSVSASQDNQVAKHRDAFDCGTDDKDYFNCGTDNEDNFECETDDENIFQNTESSMEDNRMEAFEAGPSVHNNRRVGVAVDFESHSSEIINSNTSFSEDSSTKSQRDATISGSSGSPEPGGALTPDSSDSFQGNDALHTSPFHRQVGVARLRIEQLSLFDHDTTQYEQYADVSICSDDSQRDHDDCPADAEQDASGSQHSASSGAPSQDTCQSTKRPRLNTGNETEAEDSDPDPDDNQGRTRPDQKKQKSGCEGPRFACPYQAFEPSQNCFVPHARNPKGGCEHISRLKHHLKRRHTQAYRCRRCWSSFDSCEKVKDHEAKGKCNRRTMPQNERFMNAQSEAGIEKACKSVPATEAWWNLFRLLIPGMQGRDLESLIQQYGPNYPYYFRREPNLIIPSVTLSNNYFEPVPQAGPNQESVFTRNSDHQDLLTPSDVNLNVASTTYAMQPISSQTFSVPVFQNFNVEAAEDNFVHTLDTPETSISALGGSSLDFSSSSSNLQSLLEMPFMPENPVPVSSTSNQGHLRRNYERLRERNLQAEADNMALREAAHGAVADLNHLNNLVEELLNLEDLPDELFDKISKASAILTSARRKLQ